jgi:hypothetical protein
MNLNVVFNKILLWHCQGLSSSMSLSCGVFYIKLATVVHGVPIIKIHCRAQQDGCAQRTDAHVRQKPTIKDSLQWTLQRSSSIAPSLSRLSTKPLTASSVSTCLSSSPNMSSVSRILLSSRLGTTSAGLSRLGTRPPSPDACPGGLFLSLLLLLWPFGASAAGGQGVWEPLPSPAPGMAFSL